MASELTATVGRRMDVFGTPTTRTRLLLLAAVVGAQLLLEVGGTRCGGYSVNVVVNDSDIRNLYIPPYACPTPDDHESLTQCCEPLQYGCCTTKKRQFFEVDQWVGAGIAVLVVLIVAAIIAVLITCCCYERCPLYLTCRVEAKPDYLACPSDTYYMDMPSENAKVSKSYHPMQKTCIKF